MSRQKFRIRDENKIIFYNENYKTYFKSYKTYLIQKETMNLVI